MTRQERKQRRRKTEKRVRFAAVLVLLGIVAGGNYVYAKYFSEGAQRGIAIASGIYFTANYASEVEDDEDNFFESVVKASYTGNNIEFNFEVRNYQNSLLFNESGVVIPYSISFWLEDDPVNADYTVTWEEDEQPLEKGSKVTFDGQSIEGGTAQANPYKITIVEPNGTFDYPVPIYVEVQTAPGATIEKTLRGKMVFYKGTTSDHYIASQGFITVTDEETSEFEYIQKQSILTYEIKTMGEVATGDVTEELKVSWNPELLEIDLFDEAYLAWLESETGDKLVKDSVTMDRNGVPTDSNGWKYITIEVLPYSSQTVGFLRGINFESTVTDMEILNAAVKVEEYNQ